MSDTAFRSGELAPCYRRPWGEPSGRRRDRLNPHRVTRGWEEPLLQLSAEQFEQVLQVCEATGWCGEDALAFLSLDARAGRLIRCAVFAGAVLKPVRRRRKRRRRRRRS